MSRNQTHSSSVPPPESSNLFAGAMIAGREDDRHLRVLYELCSMMVDAFKFPIPTSLPCPASASASTSRRPPPPLPPQLQLISAGRFSPAAFGCLFLGLSFALMLFGSVIFAIGLILAPWVVLFVLFFYVAGVVSNLSELARAILYDDKEVFQAWISSSRQPHDD